MRGAAARLPETRTRLRIVHLAGGAGPDAPNGVARVAYFLSQAQRALGHEVLVVGEREAHLDARAAIGDKSWTVVTNRVAYTVRYVSPTLTRELLACRPHVVHMHSVHVPEHLSLARYLRRAGIPYCVTTHGGVSRLAQRRSRLKKRVAWWVAEREFFAGALFVHALTRAEADDVASCGITAPTVVAPNGIDPQTVARPMNPTLLQTLAPELRGRRVFLYMGRIAVAQKGLDLLLEGFALADLRDAHLVLIGPDWRRGRGELERSINRLGLRSQVTFFDGQTPQRCADLIAGADVFLHTSRWEGVPLAVLEAGVWGKPCLLTHAADPEGAFAAAGGAVVVDATAGEIAQGLRACDALERSQLMAMGERARRAVTDRFTWSRAADVLIDAYRVAGVGCE